MVRSISKTTRLPQDILKIVKFRARKEEVDESTALRQLLRIGTKQYIAQLYSKAEITLREASELLNQPLREALQTIWDQGVGGNITLETQQRILEFIRSRASSREHSSKHKDNW